MQAEASVDVFFESEAKGPSPSVGCKVTCSSHETADSLPYASPPQAANGTSSTSKKRKRPTSKPLNRHIRDLKREDNYAAYGHRPSARTVSKVVVQAAVAPEEIDLASLPVANGAYEAKGEEEAGMEACTLEEAKALGLKVFQWDGRYVNLAFSAELCIDTDLKASSRVYRTRRVRLHGTGG